MSLPTHLQQQSSLLGTQQNNTGQKTSQVVDALQHFFSPICNAVPPIQTAHVRKISGARQLADKQRDEAEMQRLKPVKEVNTATRFAVVFSVLCSVSYVARASVNPYPPSNPNQNLLGLECDPPFGYLRNVCGPELILSEEIVPTPEYIYG